MIRSVPSLATLQRQPNNVTCCTSPPDPHTNPAVAPLSLRLARNYRPSGTGKSRLKAIIPVLWISFISSARREHARAHINRASNLILCAWVYVCTLNTLAHSRIADRGIEYTRIPHVYIGGHCSLLMVANTTQHRYFSPSLDRISQFDPTHGRRPCTTSGSLQRESVREKLNNRRLNLHFFSPLAYFITVKCNILYRVCNIGIHRISASLSGQEKSSCGMFQILLYFQLHVLNCIRIIQRYNHF